MEGEPSPDAQFGIVISSSNPFNIRLVAPPDKRHNIRHRRRGCIAPHIGKPTVNWNRAYRCNLALTHSSRGPAHGRIFPSPAWPPYRTLPAIRIDDGAQIALTLLVAVSWIFLTIKNTPTSMYK